MSDRIFRVTVRGAFEGPVAPAARESDGLTVVEPTADATQVRWGL